VTQPALDTFQVGPFIYQVGQIVNVSNFLYPALFIAMSNWHKINARYLSKEWRETNPDIGSVLQQCILLAENKNGSQRELFFIHDGELLDVDGNDAVRAKELITAQQGFWIAAPTVLTPELRVKWKATFYDYGVIPYFHEQLDGIPEAGK
jgi:hypothetical protein